jgi:cellulose biosynthesis protein BcsQ
MIIAVASSKGGVGKSTIARHLAAWLHEQGFTVTLADCDAQESSSQWAREATPGIRLVRLATAEDILEDLPQLGREVDFVVADGPGSNSDISRSLNSWADIAIVPCKASMLEVRALAKATQALRHMQQVRKGPPEALIVLSMVGKNYRLTQGHEGRRRRSSPARRKNGVDAAANLCRRAGAGGGRLAHGRPWARSRPRGPLFLPRGAGGYRRGGKAAIETGNSMNDARNRPWPNADR